MVLPKNLFYEIDFYLVERKRKSFAYYNSYLAIISKNFY